MALPSIAGRARAMAPRPGMDKMVFYNSVRTPVAWADKKATEQKRREKRLMSRFHQPDKQAQLGTENLMHTQPGKRRQTKVPAQGDAVVPHTEAQAGKSGFYFVVTTTQ